MTSAGSGNTQTLINDYSDSHARAWSVSVG